MTKDTVDPPCRPRTVATDAPIPPSGPMPPGLIWAPNRGPTVEQLAGSPGAPHTPDTHISEKPVGCYTESPKATVVIDDPSTYEFVVNFKGNFYSYDPLSLQIAMAEKGIQAETPLHKAVHCLRDLMKIPDLPDTGAMQAWDAFVKHCEDIQKKTPYLPRSQPTSESNAQNSDQDTSGPVL